MIIQSLGHFFIVYGYFVAFPVMVVEGPIATMVMAALASHGYFNIGIVFAISLTADLLSDYIFYQIGYNGGGRLISRMVKGAWLDIDRTKAFNNQFQHYGNKAVFFAKILPGLVPPVFISAGLTKYPIRKFYKHALAGGILWTGGLSVLGFYFGRHLRSVESLLSKTGIVLCIAVILIILYKYIFGKIFAKRALSKRGAESLDNVAK